MCIFAEVKLHSAICKQLALPSFALTLQKTNRKMNHKKIILSIALGCIGYTSGISASPILKAEMTYKKDKTEKSKTVDTTPANIYWTDANGKVSYSINANVSPVVKVALDLFEGDMKAVTGFAAKQKANAPIQIYQLDMLSNKEFSAVEKLGAPLHQFITKKESFYIDTRKGKLIVIGSDARGTAYGIMQLSKMAGVSPWTGWNDLQPQPRRSLYTAVGTGGVYLPDIEYRGLALNSHRWMNTKNDSQIARLMLRLRANTLWQVDGKHEGDFNKAVADSFDISVAQNHKVTELTGKKHNKKHKVSIENLKLIGDEEMRFSTLSPGLLLDMLDNDTFYASKSHHGSKHHGGTKDTNKQVGDEKPIGDIAWIANVDDPKMAAYQLSVFMDKAWSTQSLTSKTIERHLGTWLSCQLGKNLHKKVLPLIQDYYRLTSIRQPAYMAMPYGDTEFHSGEFGNELERYLYAYDQLKAKAEGIERTLQDNLKDGYFELVKYPIYRAALIAEKELEAQEARHIARPGLFDKDSEAKAAAAVSLTAYNQLKQLNAQYTTIATRHRQPSFVVYGAEMQSPTLPGTLSASDIQKYRKDAFNRTEDLKPLTNYKSDVIAKNACDWTTTTPARNTDGKKSSSTSSASATAETIQLLPLLGHSNQAVKLPKGASLNYTFYTSQSGDARFTLAAIPNYMSGVKNMRVSVSIDHAEPVELEINEAYNGKQWKLDLWRGQTLRNFYVTLPSGNHSIEITALDDHVILDQWILDYDVDREYYIIPVGK